MNWDFPNRIQQACRKCGESNPVEAVMCYACFTPLPGIEWSMYEEKKRRARTEQAIQWALLVSGGALFFYGLTRRSWRGLWWTMLGSGLVCLRSNGRWFNFQLPVVISFPEAVDPPGSRMQAEPIVRIVNTILMYAIKDQASEIRIEPTTKGVEVYYVVDGEPREQMRVPRYVLEPMVQRIQIMSDMDILRPHATQSGPISVRLHGREYYLYTSIVTTEFGKKIVMAFEEETESSGNQVTWEIPHE